MNDLYEKLLKNKPLIMGILNFTPDSFSDGGKYYNVDLALKQIEKMIKDGATIIDVGCESTRPNCKSISLEEEMERLNNIIFSIVREFSGILLSIDTYKKEVADFAISNGFNIINDILGCMGNGMEYVAKKYEVPIILMHNGELEKENEINDLISKLNISKQICLDAGINPKNIIIDPGIGFGKDVTTNLNITQNLDKLKVLNSTILYAASRKRTTNFILGGDSKVEDRDIVSATLSYEAIKKGADIVRVHNVKVMNEMLMTYKFL